MASYLAKLKSLANRALKPLRHRIDHDTAVIRFDRLFELLAKKNLEPATVFDVGVASGTPWLYEAAPDAKYYLIDPTPDSLPHMQDIAKKLNAEIMNFALGDKAGVIKFFRRPDHEGSTMFEDHENISKEEINVPIRRFDEVVGDFPRPALMKIDIQGAELLALKGMGDRIRDIDCIIVETALISSLKDSPEFGEVAAFMDSKGFALYEITGVLRRPLDRAMTYIDAVFVPKTSELRSDKRWG